MAADIPGDALNQAPLAPRISIQTSSSWRVARAGPAVLGDEEPASVTAPLSLFDPAEPPIAITIQPTADHGLGETTMHPDAAVPPTTVQSAPPAAPRQVPKTVPAPTPAAPPPARVAKAQLKELPAPPPTVVVRNAGPAPAAPPAPPPPAVGPPGLPPPPIIQVPIPGLPPILVWPPFNPPPPQGPGWYPGPGPGGPKHGHGHGDEGD